VVSKHVSPGGIGGARIGKGTQKNDQKNPERKGNGNTRFPKRKKGVSGFHPEKGRGTKGKKVMGDRTGREGGAWTGGKRGRGQSAGHKE